MSPCIPFVTNSAADLRTLLYFVLIGPIIGVPLLGLFGGGPAGAISLTFVVAVGVGLLPLVTAAGIGLLGILPDSEQRLLRSAFAATIDWEPLF